MGSIIVGLGLDELDNFEIVEVSAKSGLGMADAFAKFYSMLTGDEVKKTKFSRGVSLFTRDGMPITSKRDDSAVIDQEMLDSGFTIAVSQFAKTFDGDSDANPASIGFYENAENGTFIVGKSAHYIGSLLWTKDLGILIDQSKAALKDFLEHLENTCRSCEPDIVAQIVCQYATNLM